MDREQFQQKIGGSEQGISEKKISRRDFLDLIIKTGLFTALAGLIAPALTYLWPVTRGGPVTGLMEVGNAEEIPIGGSKKVSAGGSPVLILRTPQGFKAYSAICTHLGCLVDWNGRQQKIECPCHAGFFDTEGRVVGGPPPRPLPIYEVKMIGEKLFIKL